MKVAIVGGGIAGLAAAWELRERAEVTVVEPGRLGGRILTTSFAGHRVDEGPDAFLTRVPEAVQLCRELELENELVAPAVGGSAIWLGGKLHALPGGLVLGVPKQLGGLLRSRILSPLGVARAGLDLVLPRRRPPSGLTVRDLVADRFGAQVADRLVDPLVGGIHAGWTGALGAEEVTPQLVAAAERSRSLVLGLRHTAPGAGGPMFLTPRSGLSQMVEILVDKLKVAGVEFAATEVTAVRSGPGSRVNVDPLDETFDAAIIATPPREVVKLLGPDSGVEPLAQVPAASVTLVTASLSGELPAGLNGFLVPRSEGRLMTACSFASNKWPHWTDEGTSLVRISAGRYGSEEVMDIDDATATARLLEELAEALGKSLSPQLTRVSRWPGAFPQYVSGHRSMVAAVEKALSDHHPRVALAGSTYRGSGIPACIASGRRAAAAVTEMATANLS